jgi:hypothetical protein
MGFSCPVCDDPQADGVHLANHLAITALTRGGDHETWLDDHVPEWETLSEDELAEQVREMAEDADYPQVFEDTTTDHEHAEHDHAGEHSHGNSPRQSNADLPPGADMVAEDLTEDTEGVIREVMELTRQRATDGESTESDTGDDETDNSETE